jgi:hypothetical protein
MPSYPLKFRCCQHIKVNGTQCGSPALRDEKYCYYHLHCNQKNMEIKRNFPAHANLVLPTLEDANSIQAGLADVMRLVATNQIDHRTAALLLHALRTASINLKRTSFEPPHPTHVVIDPLCVEHRPIGATAWSAEEGREYDDLDTGEDGKSENKNGVVGEDVMRLVDLMAFHPGFVEWRTSHYRAQQEKELIGT